MRSIMKHPRPALLTAMVVTTAILIAGAGNLPPVAVEAFTCNPAGGGGRIIIDPTRRSPATTSSGGKVAAGTPPLPTRNNDGGAKISVTRTKIGAAAATDRTRPSVGIVSPVALAASVAATDGDAAAEGLRSKITRLTTSLSLGPAAIAIAAAGRESLSGTARGAARSVARTVRRSIPTRTRRENRMRLRKFRSATRTVLRLLRILGLAAPVALTYPLAKRARSKETYERWLEFCLRQSERGGAVVIKLCQWASSRPDIFGTDFCSVFGRLQDGTTPHPWGHTDRVLREAYGEDYGDHLRVREHDEVLGSGCIAQVYRGTITDDDTGEDRDVAIKVIHPNVREGIEHDLNILRFLAGYLERLPFGYGERLRWNNLCGMVEEFSRMLRPQLDLRNEADHLAKFNHNFRNDPNVIFPRNVDGYEANPDVLVETYCDGVPVERFCREHANDDHELRANLCDLAARTMCVMIFEHNFVHGDLHPGNIYVTPDGKKLVLLDCGIVNEYDDDDHDLIVNIIAAFIRMDGRRAAELMASDSERRLRLEDGGDVGRQHSRDVDEYVERIELLSKTPRKSDFAFEKVTTYANYIFNAAARHHVLMNPTFVSFAMAVKVQEGVALMLNPSFELIRIANPIILRCEANRLRERGFDQFVRQLVEDAWRDWRVRLGQQVAPEVVEGDAREDDLFPPALKPAAA